MHTACSDVRALSDNRIRFDHYVGINGDRERKFCGKVNHRGLMNAGLIGPRGVQQCSGTRERQTRVHSDQEWLASSGRCGKFPGDHGASRRRQSLLQMLLVLNKHQIAKPCLSDAGDADDLDAAVADEASGGELRQRFQSLGHEVVIAVEDRYFRG